MKILVYVETNEGKAINGSLEVLNGAVAMGDVTAVLVGKDQEEAAAQVAACGVATEVMEVAADNEDVVVAALCQAAAEGYDAVLMSATQFGKDYAPRVAARLSTGCTTDVIAIEADGDKVAFTRPAFGGTVQEKVEMTTKPAVATVRSGSFAKIAPAAAPAAVSTKAVELAADAVKAKIVNTTKEIMETVNLEGADVIVAGGRGMGSPEGFKLVEELAALLGGVVGASRPAIEDGWASRAHQVGQSGKTVAPKLYIACGISGAMQHISGMMGSGYIVAINKDEDASIFEIADLGIVGKCEDIIPVMIEEIKKLKA